ncbi:protein yellow-like [Cloeon dipterum]|uniref:protein yellow-like n=1 Tax=Cloeon dipterum TaxID=197152 RepID=UPI0032204EF9
MSPFFAAIFLLGLCLANAINFTTVYEWDKFDFIWPTNANRSNNEQIKDKYSPEKVYPIYMAVFGERLFLSLDTLPGIPATLVWLPTSGSSTAPPKLAPFPSWDSHKEDNCDTIQRAYSMETDTDGRLWVLDQGSSNCPSKIWIFNLLNNDTTERIHQFPDAVVSHSFYKRDLRDIVLDKTTDDNLAYITESESEHIVVYSNKNDKSWSVKTPGIKWDSLAISPIREARQVYLGRRGSTELYSVSVSELKNEGGSAAAVKLIGSWTGKPYRMLIDSANVLYAAFNYQNYTSIWNISEPFREQRFHEVRRLGAYWPFTFALDTKETLWMTERNETGSGNRYKLLKADVAARSYLSSTSTATTTPQVYVNEETTQVVKSTQTSTSKSETPKPALESNETSGGYAGLIVEDFRVCQSLNKILSIVILLLVCCLVLSGIVIAWLTLMMRRMQTSYLRQNPVENNGEMYVFPDSNHQD